MNCKLSIQAIELSNRTTFLDISPFRRSLKSSRSHRTKFYGLQATFYQGVLEMTREKLEEEKIAEKMIRKFELDLQWSIDEEGGAPTTASYLVLFQETLLYFACDRFMNRSTLRVFMYLLGKIGYGNKIDKSQVQIAEGLKMQPSQVSKAIKLLIEKSVIAYSKKERVFYLNPKLGWRGSIVEYDKFVQKKKYEKIQLGEYVDELEKEMDKRATERMIEENRREQELKELENLVI